MKVLSINIGKAEELKARPGTITGIYKRPVEDSVYIGRFGLEGDEICDLKNHGGPDQSVYFYTQPDYDWWSGQLGFDIPPGTFGENLLVDALESLRVNIGDHFEVGRAVLEVTSPRIPCANFALRMTGASFLKKFIAGKRPGFYCRVVREGEVKVGDTIIQTPFDGPKLSIEQMFLDRYRKDLDDDERHKYLAVPVHEKVRADMEEALGKGRQSFKP